VERGRKQANVPLALQSTDIVNHGQVDNVYQTVPIKKRNCYGHIFTMKNKTITFLWTFVYRYVAKKHNDKTWIVANQKISLGNKTTLRLPTSM